MKFLGLFFSLLTSYSFCQFSGAAGTSGSDAIHKDSSIIIGWASSCDVTRGYLDISNPSSGLVSFGTDADGTGPADGTNVVSLGDSGVAIVTFWAPIYDGPGPDFAVFENSFSDNFLELAFVEVSSDGVNYFRFPATSNTPTDVQIGPFSATTDPTHLNNLAGKHRANYGTPFDLAELTGISELDINAITHIKIIDVVGSVDPAYGQTDMNGNLINDPFSTPFPSGGFDLDAVAVMHQENAGIDSKNQIDVSVFPNPVDQNHFISIDSDVNISSLALYSIDGTKIVETTKKSINLNGNEVEPGTYLLKINLKEQVLIKKIIVK